MPDVQQSRLSVAGCNISVQRAGSGQPLLFLHGARGAMQWTPFLSLLAESYDVIVPEHPGYGRSETPSWLDNIDDLAYFYLDFLEQMGLDGVHVIGTSLGGWVASEIAIRQVSRLKSLMLVAPAGIHVAGVPKGDIFLWSQQETAKNLFHDPAFSQAMLDHQPSEEEQDCLLKNNLTTARLAWQPRLYNPNLYKWLHRISIPTLIIWGDQDKVIPPAYGPAFQKLIPGSKLVTISECGHLPQAEKPQVLAAHVNAFIREV